MKKYTQDDNTLEINVRIKEFLRKQGSPKELARDLNVGVRVATSWLDMGITTTRPHAKAIDKMIALYGPAFCPQGPLLDQNPNVPAYAAYHS